MSARPLPRKLPRQERSRQTVERILDAAVRVLIAHGYDGASTRRIAAEAQISPGSLYQYFPNKDAIVLATVERMTEAMSARVMAAITSTGRVETVLDALLDAMVEHRELVRVVAEQVPRFGGSAKLTVFERRVSDLAAGYLAGVTQGSGQDHTTTAWMAVQCVEQLTTRYVLDEPPIPREEFLAELRRMVVGYTTARTQAMIAR